MTGRRSFGAERWRDNWRVVGAPGAVRVELSLGSGGGGGERVRALPAGTPLVLAAAGPGALTRCRIFAARSGIRLEREYLAIPTARAPACLVEGAPGPVRAFLERILVAPHGTVLDPALDLGIAALRAWNPWRLIRALAPGRIVVGVRT